jgi:hypothetical protein
MAVWPSARAELDNSMSCDRVSARCMRHRSGVKSAPTAGVAALEAAHRHRYFS